MNPGFDSRRGAGNTNDLRGKILRINVAGRRVLHDPGRQPLRARAPPRPVPRSSRWACATRSASTSTRRPTRSTWGDYGPDAGAPPTPSAARWATSSGRPRPSPSRSTAAGRTAPATNVQLQRVELRHGDARARSSTAPPARRTTRAGTPVWPTVPPATAGDALLRRQQHPPAVARADRLRPGRRPGPDGRPGLPLRRRQPVDDEVPGVLGQQGVLRRVLAGLPRGVRRRSGPTARSTTSRTSCRTPRSRRTASRSPTARSTSSSGLTGRSTCSTTATASSGPTPTPASTGSTTRPVTRRPTARITAEPDLAAAACR